AFERKGLAYRRVDLLPMVHVAVQRVLFGRRTVPGLRLAGGEKVVGSRAIMRVLDGIEPSPPLLPADAARRAKVEGAEAWGEDVHVADLQVASSLRLLMTMGDLRPRIEERPAGALALALFPAYPGHMPAGALA